MYQALAQLQGALYQGMCGSYINGAVSFAQKNRLPVLNRSNMVLIVNLHKSIQFGASFDI